MPVVNVGDTFAGGTSPSSTTPSGTSSSTLPPWRLVSGGLTREVVSLGAAGANQLNLAAFNVENLDPSDPRRSLPPWRS